MVFMGLIPQIMFVQHNLKEFKLVKIGFNIEKYVPSSHHQ